MTRHVLVRMTIAQAEAASNACDLMRDSMEADDCKLAAGRYARAGAAIDRALSERAKGGR